MAKDKATPLNWTDWIKSEEGKRCADPSTLKLDPRQGEFLENRLWAAFVAGAKYERDLVEGGVQ